MAQPVRWISILIVDDHSGVRQGVRGFLEAQADLPVVGAAESGEQAVRLAQTYRADGPAPAWHERCRGNASRQAGLLAGNSGLHSDSTTKL